MKAAHPFDSSLVLRDDLVKAVFCIVTGGATAVAANISTKIEGWTTKALELQLKESELHAKMTAHRRRVVEKKTLLLFRDILEKVKCEDEKLPAGFNITGQIPVSHIFEHRTDTNEVIWEAKEWLWRRNQGGEGGDQVLLEQAGTSEP